MVRVLVHVPNFGGLSGSEDRGGDDNSIQFINFGRVGDKSCKEWRQKIGGVEGWVTTIFRLFRPTLPDKNATFLFRISFFNTIFCNTTIYFMPVKRLVQLQFCLKFFWLTSHKLRFISLKSNRIVKTYFIRRYVNVKILLT